MPLTPVVSLISGIKRTQVLTLGLLSVGLVPSVSAQESERERIQRALQNYESRTLNIPHIDTEPAVEIDGLLNDVSWQQANQVEIAWQHRPVGGVPARSATTVYIMEDGENLYVGFKAEDPDPDSIPSYLRDRDQMYPDDWVGFGIDTYGDGSRAFEFFANALGVQGDAIASGNNEDDSFDAIFDTGGQITATGFEVEFAIPLSQLRFPSREGMQQWRMFFTRVQNKDQRYQNFQYPIDLDNSCFICQYQPTEGLAGATPSKQFQIVPTFTARTVQSRTPAVANSTSRETDYEPGIDDFRWGITPDLSLNATLNPDFSQLEADVAQLNVNTTQALFFPERRPFFLEGRDFFDTRLNLVNTRNIADPDYGVKLTGKVGSNVYGVLSARDASTNFLVADSESSSIETLDIEHQVGLLRYRHDFGNSTHLGALLTQREGDDYSNQVLSVDGRYRINNRDTVQAQVVQTRSENPLELIDEFGMQARSSGDAYRVDYHHDSADWFWGGTAERFDPDFRADTGFISQADIARTTAELGRNWRGQPGAFITNFNLGVEVRTTDTVSTNDFLQTTKVLFSNINLPRNTQIHYDRLHNEQVYNGSRFNMKSDNIFLRSNITGGLNIFSRVRWGDNLDFTNTRKADILELTQEVNYNITRNILVRLRHNFRRLEHNDQKLFTANLTDLRLTYRFSVRSALQLTTIHNDLKTDPTIYNAKLDRRKQNVDAQLLFTYKLNPQSEFFAGYSTSGLNDDELSSLERTSDAFFIKLSYAWQL